MPGNQLPKVPEGLRDLMKSLTKEILREKPTDLYEFSAQFFEKIVQERKDFKVKEFEPVSEYDFIKNRGERNSFPSALIYSIIPVGLTELIKDFIKAVLRQRPENICVFAVDYFRRLQKIKKNERIDYLTFEKSKEQFSFASYVRCTCGGLKGIPATYNNNTNNNNNNNEGEFTNEVSNHENCTTNFTHLNGNEQFGSGKNVVVRKKSELVFDEKTIKAVYIIQKFCRRYILRKKREAHQNGQILQGKAGQQLFEQSGNAINENEGYSHHLKNKKNEATLVATSATSLVGKYLKESFQSNDSQNESSQQFDSKLEIPLNSANESGLVAIKNEYKNEKNINKREVNETTDEKVVEEKTINDAGNFAKLQKGESILNTAQAKNNSTNEKTSNEELNDPNEEKHADFNNQIDSLTDSKESKANLKNLKETISKDSDSIERQHEKHSKNESVGTEDSMDKEQKLSDIKVDVAEENSKVIEIKKNDLENKKLNIEKVDQDENEKHNEELKGNEANNEEIKSKTNLQTEIAQKTLQKNEFNQETQEISKSMGTPIKSLDNDELTATGNNIEDSYDKETGEKIVASAQANDDTTNDTVEELPKPNDEATTEIINNENKLKEANNAQSVKNINIENNLNETDQAKDQDDQILDVLIKNNAVESEIIKANENLSEINDDNKPDENTTKKEAEDSNKSQSQELNNDENENAKNAVELNEQSGHQGLDDKPDENTTKIQAEDSNKSESQEQNNEESKNTKSDVEFNENSTHQAVSEPETIEDVIEDNQKDPIKESEATTELLSTMNQNSAHDSVENISNDEKESSFDNENNTRHKREIGNLKNSKEIVSTEVISSEKDENENSDELKMDDNSLKDLTKDFSDKCHESEETFSKELKEEANKVENIKGENGKSLSHSTEKEIVESDQLNRVVSTKALSKDKSEDENRDENKSEIADEKLDNLETIEDGAEQGPNQLQKKNLETTANKSLEEESESFDLKNQINDGQNENLKQSLETELNATSANDEEKAERTEQQKEKDLEERKEKDLEEQKEKDLEERKEKDLEEQKEKDLEERKEKDLEEQKEKDLKDTEKEKLNMKLSDGGSSNDSNDKIGKIIENFEETKPVEEGQNETDMKNLSEKQHESEKENLHKDNDDKRKIAAKAEDGKELEVESTKDENNLLAKSEHKNGTMGEDNSNKMAAKRLDDNVGENLMEHKQENEVQDKERENNKSKETAESLQEIDKDKKQEPESKQEEISQKEKEADQVEVNEEKNGEHLEQKKTEKIEEAEEKIMTTEEKEEEKQKEAIKSEENQIKTEKENLHTKKEETSKLVKHPTADDTDGVIHENVKQSSEDGQKKYNESLEEPIEENSKNLETKTEEKMKSKEESLEKTFNKEIKSLEDAKNEDKSLDPTTKNAEHTKVEENLENPLEEFKNEVLKRSQEESFEKPHDEETKNKDDKKSQEKSSEKSLDEQLESEFKESHGGSLEKSLDEENKNEKDKKSQENSLQKSLDDELENKESQKNQGESLEKLHDEESKNKENKKSHEKSLEKSSDAELENKEATKSQGESLDKLHDDEESKNKGSLEKSSDAELENKETTKSQGESLDNSLDEETKNKQEKTQEKSVEKSLEESKNEDSKKSQEESFKKSYDDETNLVEDAKNKENLEKSFYGVLKDEASVQSQGESLEKSQDGEAENKADEKYRENSLGKSLEEGTKCVEVKNQTETQENEEILTDKVKNDEDKKREETSNQNDNAEEAKLIPKENFEKLITENQPQKTDKDKNLEKAATNSIEDSILKKSISNSLSNNEDKDNEETHTEGDKDLTKLQEFLENERTHTVNSAFKVENDSRECTKDAVMERNSSASTLPQNISSKLSEDLVLNQTTAQKDVLDENSTNTIENQTSLTEFKKLLTVDDQLDDKKVVNPVESIPENEHNQAVSLKSDMENEVSKESTEMPSAEVAKVNDVQNLDDNETENLQNIVNKAIEAEALGANKQPLHDSSIEVADNILNTNQLLKNSKKDSINDSKAEKSAQPKSLNKKAVIGKQSAPKLNESNQTVSKSEPNELLRNATNKNKEQTNKDHEKLNEKIKNLKPKNVTKTGTDKPNDIHLEKQAEKINAKNTPSKGKDKIMPKASNLEQENSNIELNTNSQPPEESTTNSPSKKTTRICQVEGLKNEYQEQKYIQYPIAEIYLKSFKVPPATESEKDQNAEVEHLTDNKKTANKHYTSHSLSCENSNQENETEFSDSLNEEHFERDSLEVSSSKGTDIEEDSLEVEQNERKEQQVHAAHVTTERMPTYLFGTAESTESTQEQQQQQAPKVKKAIAFVIPFEKPSKVVLKDYRTTDDIIGEKTEKLIEQANGIAKEEVFDETTDEDVVTVDESRLQTIFEQNEIESPREEKLIEQLTEDSINLNKEKEEKVMLNEIPVDATTDLGTETQTAVENITPKLADDDKSKTNLVALEEPNLESNDTLSFLSDNDSITESSTFTNSKDFDETVLSDENYNFRDDAEYASSNRRSQQLAGSADNTPRGGIYEIDTHSLKLALEHPVNTDNKEAKSTIVLIQDDIDEKPAGNINLNKVTETDKHLINKRNVVLEEITEPEAKINNEQLEKAVIEMEAQNRDNIANESNENTLVDNIEMEKESLTKVLKDVKHLENIATDKDELEIDAQILKNVNEEIQVKVAADNLDNAQNNAAKTDNDSIEKQMVRLDEITKPQHKNDVQLELEPANLQSDVGVIEIKEHNENIEDNNYTLADDMEIKTESLTEFLKDVKNLNIGENGAVIKKEEVSSNHDLDDAKEGASNNGKNDQSKLDDLDTYSRDKQIIAMEEIPQDKETCIFSSTEEMQTKIHNEVAEIIEDSKEMLVDDIKTEKESVTKHLEDVKDMENLATENEDIESEKPGNQNNNAESNNLSREVESISAKLEPADLEFNTERIEAELQNKVTNITEDIDAEKESLTKLLKDVNKHNDTENGIENVDKGDESSSLEFNKEIQRNGALKTHDLVIGNKIEASKEIKPQTKEDNQLELESQNVQFDGSEMKTEVQSNENLVDNIEMEAESLTKLLKNVKDLENNIEIDKQKVVEENHQKQENIAEEKVSVIIEESPKPVDGSLNNKHIKNSTNDLVLKETEIDTYKNQKQNEENEPGEILNQNTEDSEIETSKQNDEKKQENRKEELDKLDNTKNTGNLNEFEEQILIAAPSNLATSTVAKSGEDTPNKQGIVSNIESEIATESMNNETFSNEADNSNNQENDVTRNKRSIDNINEISENEESEVVVSKIDSQPTKLTELKTLEESSNRTFGDDVEVEAESLTQLLKHMKNGDVDESTKTEATDSFDDSTNNIESINAENKTKLKNEENYLKDSTDSDSVVIKPIKTETDSLIQVIKKEKQHDPNKADESLAGEKVENQQTIDFSESKIDENEVIDNFKGNGNFVQKVQEDIKEDEIIIKETKFVSALNENKEVERNRDQNCDKELSFENKNETIEIVEKNLQESEEISNESDNEVQNETKIYVDNNSKSLLDESNTIVPESSTEKSQNSIEAALADSPEIAIIKTQNKDINATENYDTEIQVDTIKSGINENIQNENIAKGSDLSQSPDLELISDQPNITELDYERKDTIEMDSLESRHSDTSNSELITIIEKMQTAPSPPQHSPNSSTDIDETDIPTEMADNKKSNSTDVEKVNWFVGEELIDSKNTAPQLNSLDLINNLVDQHQDQNLSQAQQVNPVNIGSEMNNQVSNIKQIEKEIDNELTTQEKIVSAAKSRDSIGLKTTSSIEEYIKAIQAGSEESIAESQNQSETEKILKEKQDLKIEEEINDQQNDTAINGKQDSANAEKTEDQNDDGKIVEGANKNSVQETITNKNISQNAGVPQSKIEDNSSMPSEGFVEQGKAIIDMLKVTENFIMAQKQFCRVQAITNDNPIHDKSDAETKINNGDDDGDGNRILLTKSFLQSEIVYNSYESYVEVIEEVCIKKSVSQTTINESDSETEMNIKSKASNELEKQQQFTTEELVEKMQKRRSIELDATPSHIQEKSFEQVSFDDPVIKTMESLVDSRNTSSAEDTDEVVIKSTSTPQASFDYDPKATLKRLHTIAVDDPKVLFKSVTIDETVKYIELPTESEHTPTSTESFCLDDDTSENIRKKMMAYSLSEADSDLFEPRDVSFDVPHDDFDINTALEETETTSTETESTIVSAATKIQAGARGFLTRRRLRRLDTKSQFFDGSTRDSFGNNAISESLETMVENAAAKKIQKAYRNHRQNIKNSVKGRTKNLSHENSLAAKRLTLQRGDALRNNSSPEEEENNAENLKLDETEGAITKESDVAHNTAAIKQPKGKTTSNSKSNELKWLGIRQNSMPVQIDCEVFRVIPKHMRKRITSAESTKKRGRSVNYD